jgi:DNA repair protein RAD5
MQSTIQSKCSTLPSILDEDWVLLGEAEIMGYSTCKGPKLQSGDALEFVFPKAVGVSSKGLEPRRGPWGRGKGAAAAAEIVRFSCQRSGEVCLELWKDE